MNRLVSIFACLLIILLLVQGRSTAQGKDDKKVDMPKIKMKDLLAHIAEYKGKVVVVHLWGSWSAPDVAEFPNLVQLHEKYGDKGLVCISLSLDFNDKLRAQALKFLKEKKAVFKNFWLDEGFEGAQKEWEFEPIPVVVVYGKDGKLAKIFKTNEDVNAGKGAFTYKKDVEPFVKELLEKK